jgi:hypothetical protein
MGAFELYLIFCLATSLTLIYELFWPIIALARRDGIDNDFTKSPLLSLFIFFVVNTVFAPLVIWLLIFPSLFASAFLGITKAVREK